MLVGVLGECRAVGVDSEPWVGIGKTRPMFPCSEPSVVDSEPWVGIGKTRPMFPGSKSSVLEPSLCG